MNFYREAQNHRFPISKQDKGVLIRSPITAAGNAVREIKRDLRRFEEICQIEHALHVCSKPKYVCTDF